MSQALVPLSETEVMGAIHPAHYQEAFNPVMELCQAQAYGQLAQMLSEYRAELLQDFNQGVLECTVDEHIQLDASLRALESRANGLAIALQENTTAIAHNSHQLNANTGQLTELNDRLGMLLLLQQQQMSHPRPPVHLNVEVNASADSHSDSQGGGGWEFWAWDWTTWGIAAAVLAIVAMAVTHSRPVPGPMVPGPMVPGPMVPRSTTHQAPAPPPQYEGVY